MDTYVSITVSQCLFLTVTYHCSAKVYLRTFQGICCLESWSWSVIKKWWYSDMHVCIFIEQYHIDLATQNRDMLEWFIYKPTILSYLYIIPLYETLSLSNQMLTHWGRDKMDAISQMTFSNAFSWMKMFEFRLKFHWSLSPRVQLTVFQQWFG